VKKTAGGPSHERIYSDFYLSSQLSASVHNRQYSYDFPTLQYQFTTTRIKVILPKRRTTKDKEEIFSPLAVVDGLK
jgi:hypothetical protein